jgi:hypothetical protein
MHSSCNDGVGEVCGDEDSEEDEHSSVSLTLNPKFYNSSISLEWRGSLLKGA